MKLYQARLMMAFTAVETDLDVYVFTIGIAQKAQSLILCLSLWRPRSQKK